MLQVDLQSFVFANFYRSKGIQNVFFEGMQYKIDFVVWRKEYVRFFFSIRREEAKVVVLFFIRQCICYFLEEMEIISGIVDFGMELFVCGFWVVF